MLTLMYLVQMAMIIRLGALAVTVRAIAHLDNGTLVQCVCKCAH